MYKLNFLFLLLLFTGLNAIAQIKTQHTFFLKNNGTYVKDKDSADYTRIVEDPGPGSTVYQINDYYLNGKKKRSAQGRMAQRLIYEGAYVSYYINGNKQLEGNYINDELDGEVTAYYPNGKLYTVKVYKKEGTPVLRSQYIKTVKDIKGKDLVLNGKGKYVIYDEDFKQITAQGSVNDGVYDGIWTGKDVRRKSIYRETYAKGKLISGTSTDDKKQTYNYTELIVSPEFPGGQQALSRFLGGSIRYPRKSQDEGIEGRVYVSFTVLKTGVLHNITADSRRYPDLAAEALRVVKLSPPWKIGYYRGIADDMVCNLPVQFTLD